MADGTITIDGRKIPFNKGQTIIKAAYDAGVDIPHYCWHPGLSAPANCRMCLVEVEPPPGRPKMMLDVLSWDTEKNDYVVTKKPKLMPACQMGCADGMVVHSDSSQEVAKARSAVQELLLLNHPVDCPICDQAGECDLQDYWLEHQRKGKRMHQEPTAGTRCDSHVAAGRRGVNARLACRRVHGRDKGRGATHRRTRCHPLPIKRGGGWWLVRQQRGKRRCGRGRGRRYIRGYSRRYQRG